MDYIFSQQLEMSVMDLRIDTNTGAEYAVLYDNPTSVAAQKQMTLKAFPSITA